MASLQSVTDSPCDRCGEMSAEPFEELCLECSANNDGRVIL